jgi:hypothetical protein
MKDGSMPDEIGETWNKVVSQINALAACLGCLIGTLRAAGHIDDALLEQLFATADSLLPEQTGLDGAKTLAMLRGIAKAITADPA